MVNKMTDNGFRSVINDNGTCNFENLYYRLALMSETERENMPFALFTTDRGMLNGSEAYKYLKDKIEKTA